MSLVDNQFCFYHGTRRGIKTTILMSWKYPRYVYHGLCSEIFLDQNKGRPEYISPGHSILLRISRDL